MPPKKFSAQSVQFLKRNRRHKVEFFSVIVFHVVFGFLREKLFFHFDIREFRLLVISGIIASYLCYHVQKFRNFHQLGGPHGPIQEQAYFTFSSKSERNVGRARSVRQQRSKVKLSA